MRLLKQEAVMVMGVHKLVHVVSRYLPHSTPADQSDVREDFRWREASYTLRKKGQRTRGGK